MTRFQGMLQQTLFSFPYVDFHALWKMPWITGSSWKDLTT